MSKREGNLIVNRIDMTEEKIKKLGEYQLKVDGEVLEVFET